MGSIKRQKLTKIIFKYEGVIFWKNASNQEINQIENKDDLKKCSGIVS